MKILAASDVHGDHQVIKKLAQKAKDEEVDLVLLCGDLTYAESDLTGIVGPFKKIDKKVILIPGNHETFAAAEFLAEQYSPGVYNLHGRSVMLYGDIGIFGMGGANIGLFEVPEDETHAALTKAEKKITNARFKIMMTHSPPHKTKLDNLWTHVGSPGVRKAIEEIQPNLHLCGHIHETFEQQDQIGNTKTINAGPRGVIIDIKKKDN